MGVPMDACQACAPARAAGLKWWGNLFTCIMTWRARNVDIHEELAKYV